MVGITGDVAGVAAFYTADGVDEVVPDGFAFAVFVPGAFNLIRRSGHAKNEFFRELERSELHLRLEQFAGKRGAWWQDVKRSCSAERLAKEIATIQIAPTAHASLLDKTSVVFSGTGTLPACGCFCKAYRRWTARNDCPTYFRKRDAVILACAQIIRQEG